jgi:hypothetical protein
MTRMLRSQQKRNNPSAEAEKVPFRKKPQHPRTLGLFALMKVSLIAQAGLTLLHPRNAVPPRNNQAAGYSLPV